MFRAETALSHKLPINLFSCIQDGSTSFLAIDEVGRGCLAGPVFVCASFWVPEKGNTLLPKQKWLSHVRDSKKLTPQARELCFQEMMKSFGMNLSDVFVAENGPQELSSSFNTIRLGAEEFLKIKKTVSQKSAASYQCAAFCLGSSTAQEIDELNIWNAVQLAAGRALAFLKDKLGEDTFQSAAILMDGKSFIKVPPFFQNHVQAAVVQADEFFVSVGFSSIVAKVCRDKFMEAQDLVHPHYGFYSHKGYGTPEHFKNIQKYGTCGIHRKSFLNNAAGRA